MKGKRVGVVFGGPSSEREVSIRSGRAVCESLKRSGYNIIEIGEHGSIEKDLIDKKVDVAFIVLHGRYGEDGTLQKFLELNNISYTGSDSSSSRNAIDKHLAKEIFTANNIPTPDYIVAEKGKDMEALLNKVEKRFSFPVVVKPATEGSSIGLSIVKERVLFLDAVKTAFNYDNKLVIEKFIQGEEITVGILGEEPLAVVRICPKSGFYDFESKYTAGLTEYEVPAKLPEDLYKQIQSIGLASHKALGCRDFSRVDLRLAPDGSLWVLEVNTIPGFTATSLLPKTAQAVGICFDDLCERMLGFAFNRVKNGAQ